MSTSRWHLVAYDVSNARRLRRVHRLLAGRGIWLQRSVFLVQADNDEIRDLLAITANLVHSREDHVAAWRLVSRSRLWFSRAPLDVSPLLLPAAPGSTSGTAPSPNSMNRED